MAEGKKKAMQEGQESSLPPTTGDGELSETDAEKVSGGIPCLPPAAPAGPQPVPYPNINE